MSYGAPLISANLDPIRSAQGAPCVMLPLPIDVSVRESAVYKYFSGCQGFLAPSVLGPGYYPYTFVQLAPTLNGTCARTWLSYQLWATRTDVVVYDTSAIGGPDIRFSCVSSLSGAGDCAQSTYPTSADCPAAYNLDIPLTNITYQWAFGTIVAGTTNTHFRTDNSYPDVPTSVYTDSTLSDLLDMSGRWATAQAAFLGHTFALDTGVPAWSMAFNDAPQVILPVNTEGLAYDSNIPPNPPSSYDDSAIMVGTWPSAPFVPSGASCVSGWAIDFISRGIAAYRGQVFNTSSYAGSYWIGRWRQTGDDELLSPASLIEVVSTGGILAPAGTMSGSIYLDRIECPFTPGSPFPFAQLPTGQPQAVFTDIYFVVVNATPAAWAAANGYTLAA